MVINCRNFVVTSCDMPSNNDSDLFYIILFIVYLFNNLYLRHEMCNLSFKTDGPPAYCAARNQTES